MARKTLFSMAMALAVVAGAFADRTLNDGLAVYLTFNASMTDNAVPGSPVTPEASTATAPTLANNGMVGKCLNVPSGAFVKLTGSDSVTLANNSLGFEDSNRSFTAIVWVNCGALANDPVIFANKNWGGTEKGALLCAKKSGSTPIVQFNAANGNSRIDQTASNMQFTGEGTGKWTFYAMVCTNGTFYCYQGKSDGTFSSKNPAALSNFDMDTGYPFVLGQQGNCAYGRIFTGKLDDFALWTRALSADDIKRIYECGRSGMELGDLLKVDANDAPTMSETAFDENSVTLAFGGRRTKTHGLYLAYGAADGGADKYAWDSFEKIADIAPETTEYVYAIPEAFKTANAGFRFFLMQTTDLPYVKEVEYAHSDGTAYIDSGIAPRRDLITEFDVRLTADNGAYQNLFGTFCVDGNKLSNYGMCRYYAPGNGYNNKWDREYNANKSYQFTGSCVLNADYHVVFSTTNLFVNGDEQHSNITLSQFVEGGTPTVNLFRDEKLKSDGTFITYDQTMIGYFKNFSLYTPKHKVRDFKPAVDADGIVGMFDAVTGEFYGSAATALTAGADLDATRCGWVRAVSAAYGGNTAYQARYTGAGTNPLDFSDATNWTDCTNSYGVAIPDVAATKETAVTVRGVTPFALPTAMPAWSSIKFENVILDADAQWGGLDLAKVVAGSAVDLNGHSLSLVANAGTFSTAFAVTDMSTDTANPGTLHLNVASGTTFSNAGLALSGNLKLSKEGAGVYVASKTGQAYTGGTDVAGTVRLGAEVASCLGTGTVTVGNGATFDIYGKNASACTMVLAGGTITSSASGANNTLPLRLIQTENSRITFQNLSANHDMYMNGSEWNLGGKTLTLKMDGKDPDLYIQQTGGTTSMDTTISNGTFKVEVAATAVNGSKQKNRAWVHIANLNGRDGLNLDLGGSTLRMEAATKNSSVYGFTAAPAYGDVKSTMTMEVYGTYLPASSYGFNMTMMDGSTIDLSKRTGSWNSSFSNGTDTQDPNPKVSFAANATVTVDLHGRTDLETLAVSASPYVITWASAPDATTQFVLDEATAVMPFRLKVKDAGLRLSSVHGFMIIVK